MWHERNWTVLLAVLVLWASVGLLLGLSLDHNDGRLIYPLDDTYIHLAMAKNLSQHGVWGVTEHGFSSTTSSILWTALLAVCFVAFGVQPAMPLILALLAASGLVLLAGRVLAWQKLPPLVSLAALLLLIFVGPLPTLVLSGMEHALQSLLVLAFAIAAAASLAVEGAPIPHRLRLWLSLLAPLLTLVRYEGLFLVAAFGLLCVVRRRPVLGVVVGAAALAPLVLYGALSVARGWFWLPNSILLKGNVPELGAADGWWQFFRHSGYWSVRSSIHILLVTALGVWLLFLNRRTGGRIWRPGTTMVLLFLATAVVHGQLAGTGWLFRYEAYLVVLGLLSAVSLGGGWLGEPPPGARASQPATPPPLLRRAAVLVPSLVVVAYLVVSRAWPGLGLGVRATNDRYLEHYFAARFVEESYGDSTVVVNDIGMVAFYSRSRILDLYGLASLEPFAFRRQPEGYRRRDVDSWARSEGARIAILQVEWEEIRPRIPRSWIQVGEWEIPRNVLFGDTRVGFFAVDPDEEERLVSKLRSFRSRLPEEIVERGRYVAGSGAGIP